LDKIAKDNKSKQPLVHQYLKQDFFRSKIDLGLHGKKGFKV